MVIVHLYYENVQFRRFTLDNVPYGPYSFGKIIGEYTRFAAGGFVFVSGLAIGAIFLPKTREKLRRWKTYRHMWWRSLKLLGWQYVVAILWVLLGVARGNHPPITSIPKFLLDVILLREGDDLLPLYVILIACAPFMLACRRIKMGWIPLAAASIGLFILGRFFPYAISFATGNFPPLLWQIFFVTGLLCGSVLKQYSEFSAVRKMAIASAAWLAFAFLFWAEYWRELNLPACAVNLVFSKLPLSAPEMLRYIAIIVGITVSTDLAWSRISANSFTSFSATLGRSSLVVYVVHIFLMELAGAAARYWYWMGLWQLTFIPLSLAVLWLVAVIVQYPGTGHFPSSHPKSARLETD
jgi:hypothetical protein